MEEKQLVGTVTHFFPKIMVAVVKLEKELRVGDQILVEGHGESFEQTIDSMQIDRSPISSAKKGQEIAIKVENTVKEKFQIFKL